MLASITDGISRYYPSFYEKISYHGFVTTTVQTFVYFIKCRVLKMKPAQLCLQTKKRCRKRLQTWYVALQVACPSLCLLVCLSTISLSLILYFTNLCTRDEKKRDLLRSNLRERPDLTLSTCERPTASILPLPRLHAYNETKTAEV